MLCMKCLYSVYHTIQWDINMYKQCVKKEVSDRQPRTGGFCYWAREFCS